MAKARAKVAATSKTRQSPVRGSALAVVVVFTAIIATVGIACFNLSKIAGGDREAQNATDAGNLNVARQDQAAIGVKLTDREKEDFGDLADRNGLITLRTYNRVVARAMLIAMNAQRLRTATAMQHAREVLGLAQTNSNSIGVRLREVLADATQSTAFFHAVAQANSCRLLASDAKVVHKEKDFATSYMYRGDASNIYVDNAHYMSAGDRQRLEAMGLLVSDAQGHRFIKGYQKIDLGDGFVFSFVSVNPGFAPHLVSGRDFNNNKELSTTLPADMAAKLPPNAFATASTAYNHSTSVAHAHSSCAVVGVLNAIYPPSLPSAFFRVTNPPGFNASAVIPGPNNFYAGVGTVGVYLIAGASGPIAFSSDPDIGKQWAVYNADPAGSPKPPINDNQGNPLVYDAAGEPATLALLAQIRGMSAPVTGCNDWNVSGASADANCQNFLPAFLHAFPGDPPTANGDHSALTAVEKLQDLVIHAWMDQIALVFVHSDYGCQYVSSPDGQTGLRLFDRNFQYNQKTAHFTTPGTVQQLLHQVEPIAGANVFNAIVQQIKQIKPEATDAEIIGLLNSTTLELGSVHYVYMPDDRTRALVFSTTPPRTVVAGTTPDGTPVHLSSPPFQTLGLSVNTPMFTAPGEEVGPNRYWYRQPDADQMGIGLDTAMYTPGSGYKGNLGDVTFHESVTGDGSFCNAN